MITLLISACSSFNNDTMPKPTIEASFTAPLTKSDQQEVALNTQLGLNYIEQDKLVLAKQKLVSVLEKMPNYAPGNSAMAYYLERTGDLEAAEKYYLRAIRFAAEKGGPDNNYGTFLCRQKRYQEADRYFQLAIRHAGYVNTAKAYENAGLCAQLAFNSPKAIDYFRNALRQDPSLKQSMLKLAELDNASGYYSEGYEHIKNYLALVNAPSASTLWLAIQLAGHSGDEAAVKTYAHLLGQRFAHSQEYRAYVQQRDNL